MSRFTIDDSHNPASPWPLDMETWGTRHSGSELVAPTVGASTPDVVTVGAPTPDIRIGSDNCRSPNVALEAQGWPVVAEAQAETGPLPSPPPKVLPIAPPPLRSPVIELPSPPSADVTMHTEPVLAAAAATQQPSVARRVWHPEAAVEPVQSPLHDSQFFGPKASPMHRAEARPQPPILRADSPLRPSTLSPGVVVFDGRLPGDSTPGEVAHPAFLADVLLWITDIPTFSQPPFGNEQAQDWLSNIRRECAEQQLHCIDLTDGSRMPWRNYICSHPLACEIIDVGLIRFIGQFTTDVEPDWETLDLPRLFGSQRFDFVACRANGTACRLHPSRTRYVAPGVGLLANWFWLPPLETLPLENRGLYSTAMVYNPGVSLDEPALVWLECIYKHHVYVAGGYPRDVRISVRVDTPDTDSSMFPWHSFLTRWLWGQELLREGVTSFTLTSDDAGPAVEVTTHQHPTPRTITFLTGWSRLEG